MKKMSNNGMRGLQTGDLVIQTDSMAAVLLMRVTRLSNTGICFSRVKVLFQHRFKIFNSDHLVTYLLENGDILDVRVTE